MEESYFGFHVGKVMIAMLRLLKQKGLLEENEILDLLWEAKDPLFPWSRNEIKEIIKL